ncbi:hypothetical protein H9Y04_30740 [Streptomyces sp. TRM66268-LWL]|uniref:WD40 repeat domain-containing protein n=1 Tax=Streptomyces polyasparticus TaxID=2767826 RepID=A0ABR7SPZ8_9ACTN|nr:hypothetical protein [Streptomyces polyasparticus]
MLCHPRLPLAACLDSTRPAVHVWECAEGQVNELASVGAESAPYDAPGWDRLERTPVVAWHPHDPLLVVVTEGQIIRWTPDGLSAADGFPPGAAYQNLAFSPDGSTVWASPSSDPEDTPWETSDAIALASGHVAKGRWWDTAAVEHPAGGLVTAYSSDQGATLVLFAPVAGGPAPTPMRFLRRALILDADGYEAPLFSPDGRHFAIRGNAYDQSLDIFAFPSLRRVLSTTLGEPSPGHPYPDEWLEQNRAWSRHNIAFGGQPDVLWIGTPAGALIALDLAEQRATEYDGVLSGSGVTALATTSGGHLLAATADGGLALLFLRDATRRPAPDAAEQRAAVRSFLDSSSEVPGDGDLEAHLLLTDGQRTWAEDDLETFTSAEPSDPMWLRLRAAVNKVREERT